MSFVPAVIAGVGTGLGLLFVILGLRRGVDTPGVAVVEVPAVPSAVRAELTDRPRLRLSLGVGAALVMGVLALWPVAIVLAFFENRDVAIPSIEAEHERFILFSLAAASGRNSD